MNSDKLNKIINEALTETLSEFVLSENVIDEVKGILGKYKKDKAAKPKKKNKRSRKKKGGGRVEYDFDDYKSKSKELDHADAEQIRKTIDTENTNIAALGKMVLPGHTPQGSQSQMRKMLTGERPIGSKEARKLKNLINRGRVAVK